MPDRCILLVIDGLGVGQMADVADTRPQDQGAHTFKHVVEWARASELKFFKSSGIAEYYINQRLVSASGLNLSMGRCKLAHFGADSFMGHQEIAGSLPRPPLRQFVRDIHLQLVKRLGKAGYAASFTGKYILVDGAVAIADNLETDYGLNINVVGSLQAVGFEKIKAIGQVVREAVKVGRVITMGGFQTDPADFENCFEIKTRDGYTAWGINIPKLDIYNQHYQVVHMGYGVNHLSQVPALATSQGILTTLIGKAADVIRAPGATYLPQVDTQSVLQHLVDQLHTSTQFIFANVQQTDLAGHQMDVSKYLQHLARVDAMLFEIVKQLNPDDLLIITGDHGNDPTIGHTNHTREFTPLIVINPSRGSQDLGERETLADIGASIAAYFQLPTTESGQSFI